MLNLEWVARKLLPSIIERRSLTKKKQNPNQSSASSSSPQHVPVSDRSPTSASSSSPQTAATNFSSPTATDPSTNNSPDESLAFLGPNAQSTVPPPVFMAILDEALTVLKKENLSSMFRRPQTAASTGNPSLSGTNQNNDNNYDHNNITQNNAMHPSTNFFLHDHQRTSSVSSACNEVFPEIFLEQGFKDDDEQNNNDDDETGERDLNEPSVNNSNNSNNNNNNNNRRTHVVGPVRGHAVPLAKMILNSLTQARQEKRPLPNFVFLGDLIDSGPCSIETVAIALSLMVAYEREREIILSESVVQHNSNSNNNNNNNNNNLPKPKHQGPSSAFGTPMLHAASTATTTTIATSDSSAESSPRHDRTGVTSAGCAVNSEGINNNNNNTNSNYYSSHTSAASSPLPAASRFSTESKPSYEDGPICVVLRGRHESNFPAPAKWTGTTQAGYRRLDDELSSAFGPHLDNTNNSLLKALAKLKQVFCWLPVACVVRCRVKQPIPGRAVGSGGGGGGGDSRGARRNRNINHHSATSNSFETNDRSTTTSFEIQEEQQHEQHEQGEGKEVEEEEEGGMLRAGGRRRTARSASSLSHGQQPQQQRAATTSTGSFDDHDFMMTMMLTQEEDYFFQQNRIQQTSFLCLPGGPSPALLRYSCFADMKEAVEGAAKRVLRVSANASTTISPLHVPASSLHHQEVQSEHDSSQHQGHTITLGPSVVMTTTTTTTKPSSSKKLKPRSFFASSSPSSAASIQQQKRQDEQLLRDIASAEPYEDDEDRMATTTGILFSDNGDNTRTPGMCCFSTEAAATLLARSGTQSILRGSSFSLQRIPVSTPNKIQKNVSEFALEIQHQQQQSCHQQQLYTFRPRASPYDPGYRMYRLPSHVKRAVQRGSVPHFDACASPLSLSQNNSAQDLTMLAVTSMTTSGSNSEHGNNDDGDDDCDGDGDTTTATNVVNSSGLDHVASANQTHNPLLQSASDGMTTLGKNDRTGSSASIGSSNTSQIINSNFAKNLLSMQHLPLHLQQQLLLRQQHQEQQQLQQNGKAASPSCSSSSTSALPSAHLLPLLLLSQQQQHLLQHPATSLHQSPAGAAASSSAAAVNGKTFPFLPQVVSLFSAPQFGNNFKSRNIGCVAVIQCAETCSPNSAVVGGNDRALPTPPMMVKQRGSFVTLLQFDDNEPLLFAPLAENIKKEKADDGIPSALASPSKHLINDDDDVGGDCVEIDGAAGPSEHQPINNEVRPQFSLDEKEQGLLKRLKKMCSVLKDRGQLHLVNAKS